MYLATVAGDDDVVAALLVLDPGCRRSAHRDRASCGPPKMLLLSPTRKSLAHRLLIVAAVAEHSSLAHTTEDEMSPVAMVSLACWPPS